MPLSLAQDRAAEKANAEERELLESEGLCPQVAPIDWKYIVKFTNKTKFSRLHKRGVCQFATDQRPGRRIVEVTDYAADAYCKICFRAHERPLGPEERVEEASESDQSSSGESSSTSFAE